MGTVGMDTETIMSQVVGVDIVGIALDREMKSVEDTSIVHGMNDVRDRDIDIAMSLMGSVAKDPGPGIDARDLVDEMVSVTLSHKALQTMIQSIR